MHPASITEVDDVKVSSIHRQTVVARITCAIKQPTGRKFHPTQPPLGPVGSWDGLEAGQGVKIGHRATWFGGAILKYNDATNMALKV
jgi:hypothetical protein